MKTIFLDFDGVLHGEGINGGGFFVHMPLFCAMVRPFLASVNIVISSSWREDKSLDKLKKLFEQDIQDIVVGVNPIIKERYELGGREKEIRLYCEEKQINNESWIAIDDMKIFFSENCKNLILIDGETGLSYGDIKAIEYFLQKF